MVRQSVVDIPSTPHFDFVYGAYRLSSWTIPYFATAISLRHAADHLRLATDFPGAEMVRWKLEELYQRDIDWPRVERKIVPYLTSTESPQFFNSLTIALLPLLPDGELSQEGFMDGVGWAPPPLQGEGDRFKKVLRVGPVSCGYWEEWTELSQQQARTGQLRWNPSQVFSVALDGQHRLAAIQQVGREVAGDPARLDQTFVPLVLLILDKAFGYKAPPGRALVEVLRMLFVDLNKHARTVSRARQILLDDKDPHSLCVRSLVGSQLSDNTHELAGESPRLPLSAVDWHTEQAKFDEGPYVTTILGLDWTVTRALGAKPIADYTDYPAIQRQLKAFSSSLGLDLTETRARLRTLEELELQPFAYIDDETERIARSFERVWNPAIVRLLSEFSPYKDLFVLRGKKKTFTVEFANWYQLYDRMQKDRFAGRATDEYKQFVGRLHRRDANPIPETRLRDDLAVVEGLKRGNLAFNVVFQRAYFLGFLDFRQITAAQIEELAGEEDMPDLNEAVTDNGGASEADIEIDSETESLAGATTEPLAERVQERARQYVEALNALVAAWPAFLGIDAIFSDEEGEERLFWLGTLRKAEGGIDFTQSASSRAAEVFSWVAGMVLYDSRVEPGDESDFEDFWAAVLDRETYVCKRLYRAVSRFGDAAKDSSSAARILKGQGKKVSAEACREEARVRMQWLWKCLAL